MATAQQEQQFVYSPAITSTTGGAFGLGTNLTWDAYVRDTYSRLNAALQRQATALLDRGGVTEAEARALVEQRNLILAEVRGRVSPFGRLYSEILKPSTSLPQFDNLLLHKGSIEAVITSVGKTRAVVNTLTARLRWAGRATIVLQITISAVLIIEAKPADRARVAAGQAGAMAGGVAGGWAGAWAGCAGASALASPSLAIPIWGEIGVGGACLIGGTISGLGLGAAGAYAGEKAGGAVYDYVTRLRWTSP